MSSSTCREGKSIAHQTKYLPKVKVQPQWSQLLYFQQLGLLYLMESKVSVTVNPGTECVVEAIKGDDILFKFWWFGEL